jgi:hypothetical protein
MAAASLEVGLPARGRVVLSRASWSCRHSSITSGELAREKFVVATSCRPNEGRTTARVLRR